MTVWFHFFFLTKTFKFLFLKLHYRCRYVTTIFLCCCSKHQSWLMSILKHFCFVSSIISCFVWHLKLLITGGIRRQTNTKYFFILSNWHGLKQHFVTLYLTKAATQHFRVYFTSYCPNSKTQQQHFLWILSWVIIFESFWSLSGQKFVCRLL